MSYGQRPFGLREVKITDADGSNPVALPVSLLFHFTERLRSVEFHGEAQLLGVRSYVEGIEWELEAGGITLAAYAKLTGRSVDSAGSQPNRTATLSAEAGDDLPYVRVYGRAISDDGDDIHCRLFKCKVTAFEGTLREGEFWVSSCAGVAMDDGTNGVFEFVGHETATAI